MGMPSDGEKAFAHWRERLQRIRIEADRLQRNGLSEGHAYVEASLVIDDMMARGGMNDATS